MFSHSRLTASYLVSKLLSSIKFSPAEVPKDETQIKGLTVRFDHDVRAFLEAHAQQLRISLSDVTNLFCRAIMLESSNTAAIEINRCCERVRTLISEHKIPFVYCTQLLEKADISSTDLASDSVLIEKLSPDAVHYLSQTFDVNPEWILGTSDYYIRHKDQINIYPYVSDFAHHLAMLKLDGYALKVRVCQDVNWQVECNQKSGTDLKSVVFVVSKTKHYPEIQGSITTYEQTTITTWEYIRPRYCALTFLMFCKRCNITVEGVSLRPDDYSKLGNGELCLASIDNVYTWNPFNLINPQRSRPWGVADSELIQQHYGTGYEQVNDHYIKVIEKVFTDELSLIDKEAFSQHLYDKAFNS